MREGGLTVSSFFAEGFRVLAHYRLVIAFVVPPVGVSVAMASLFLMPRGKAKGFITGAYMLLAALGGACLLFAVAGIAAGQPRDAVVPLLVPGIVLTVIMGIYTPLVVREYQQFELRKLAAEIFRRS
jgi:hypothetical protein